MIFGRLISCIIAAIFVFVACAESELRAQVTLTGAQLYSAGGNNNGTVSGGGYRYTTNSADGGGFALAIDGDDTKATSVVLEMGDNVFSFSGTVAPADPGSYVGLQLFFTDTDLLPDDSFNPETNSGVAGDLTVFTPINSPGDTLSTVAAGIQVQTYDVGAIGPAFASGLQSFTVGSNTVSVTAFSVTNTPFNPSGSFTLTVTPAAVLGDVNLDGVVNCVDLDGYIGSIDAAADGALAALDIDGDGTLEASDATTHITTLIETSNGVVGTFPGDVNCDGSVNVLGDAFALVANLGNTNATSYSQGDINFDGQVNVLGDAFVLVANLGMSNQ